MGGRMPPKAGLGSSLAEPLVRRFTNAGLPLAPATIRRTSAILREWHLTARETEIVLTAIAGLTAKESAAALDCSVHTISTHWRRIFFKTGRRTQSGVVALLVSRLCDPPRE